MLAAQQAGRVDDMLTCAHDRIVVRPMTRPGHSVYIGHTEFKLLLTDVGRAWGKHRVQWSDVTSTGDGTVTANGAVIMLADGAETEFTTFRAEFTVRDGLVTSNDTHPPPLIPNP